MNFEDLLPAVGKVENKNAPAETGATVNQNHQNVNVISHSFQAFLSSELKVSMVSNAHSTACQAVSVAEIIADIQGGKWQQSIDEIRNTFKLAQENGAKPKDAVSELKLALPAILWSGCFKFRNKPGIESHSGLLVADIDKLCESELQRVRSILQSDPHVLTLFASPTGTGLKVVFRVPADTAKHTASFTAMEKYVKQKCDVDIDQSGKDIARLCFVSHDPLATWNADVKELSVSADQLVLPPTVIPKPTVQLAASTLEDRRKIATDLLGEIDWETSTRGFCQCPGIETHTTANQPRDCWINVDGAPNIYCHHTSCCLAVDQMNHRLPREIGLSEAIAKFGPKTPPTQPNPSKSTARTSASLNVVVLPSGPVTISQTAAELFTALSPTRTLFLRGTTIVELGGRNDGSPHLEPLRVDAFRSRVEKVASLMVWRSGSTGQPVLAPALLSHDLAKAIMEAESRSLLPSIASVHSCPVLVADSIGLPKVLRDGYHPDCGGILITGRINLPPDWETVSVSEAAGRLLHLIGEMDFQCEGDRARAIAAFITPALLMGGHLADRIPIDIAEADQSQAGKGYRHELVCTLYNEKAYLVASRSGGVGSLDESLGSGLISGQPFVCLDNVRGRMDSPNIEAFITAPGLFPARVPHRGEIQIDPRRFLIQLSSNGFESTRDLANRASICRIRKRHGYEYRDTLGHVRANTGHYLGAVFRIVKAWMEAGKPRTKDTRHDRREWCQTLDWIVQNLVGTAPLMDGHQEAQERTGSAGLTWLRSVALAVKSDGKLGTPYSAGHLVEFSAQHGIAIPGANDDPKSTARIVGSHLAKAFSTATNQSITFDGMAVRREEETYQKDERSTERRKVYRFDQLG
jgi:hypothetical protein